MKTKFMLLAVVLTLCGTVFAQTTPESSASVLAAAFKKATAENKNVMIVFHASWCGWCKKFEASVNDPSCKEFFMKNYIIEHLTILETKDNKNLENPGAEELFDNSGGKGGGIPFFLIFDKSGKLLADSRMKTTGKNGETKLSNMGCPASEEEVAAFIEILKKTSKISAQEAGAISNRFKKNRS